MSKASGQDKKHAWGTQDNTYNIQDILCTFTNKY